MAPQARYVALGDSYTAAPYVPLTDIADGCLRSDGNYPHLLAEKRSYRLVDVSCGGATSADLVGRQQTFGRQTVPPQLRVLTPGTRLVTLGIGGNDAGLFGTLARGCPVSSAHRTLAPTPGSRCGNVDLAAERALITGIGKNLVKDLRQVRRRAPHATVVLIGYPRITSPARSCPRILPVARADARNIDTLTRHLRDVMSAAARAGGAKFVDMYAASQNHDVCAGSKAWVNGIHTDTQRAAALHPFAQEQRAVADRIARLVPTL